MSFAGRHNVATFNVNTEGFTFFGLSDLFNNEGAGVIYPVKGLYINTKSKFGAAPVIISDDKFINLPSHLCEEVRSILSNPEDVEDIKAGHVGVTIYEYISHNRKCYSINWEDM